MFLGIDWGRFVQPSFWLEIRPGSLSNKFEVVFGVILALSYILYFVSLYMQKHEFVDRHNLYVLFWKRFANFALTMAVIFTFIFFFRYEGIPYLGGRIWLPLWFLGGAIWLSWLLRYYYVVLPGLLAAQAEKQAKLRYFNKKK